jgi:hypothetical protein
LVAVLVLLLPLLNIDEYNRVVGVVVLVVLVVWSIKGCNCGTTNAVVVEEAVTKLNAAAKKGVEDDHIMRDPVVAVVQKYI